MNTKQFDYILELAQTLNFNRAAENLFITQPTLTYQIKEVEKELNFKLFERSGKGATLTPAGKQFCAALRTIRNELKNAVELGQNYSKKYEDNITIGIPTRSCIYFLPDAIKTFSKLHPEISVTPIFNNFYHPEEFLRGNQDIFFTFDDEMKHVPETKCYHLYKSYIYLLTQKNDILAQKKSVNIKDLKGRTLMVGGGSPPALKRLQQKVINSVDIEYFNSLNHETTLTNIASDRGICLTPGFFNDFSNEFAWIPIEYHEYFDCKLCVHMSDKRESIIEFIQILQEIYKQKSAEIRL